MTSSFAVYPSLQDRVVVISGGATGIGQAMVEAFALQGSQVVFLDILDGPAEKLVKSLSDANTDKKAKHTPVYYHCDVTDIDGSLRLVAAQIRETFPAIHGLINNAATDTRLPTLGITSQQWDDGLAVNLRHVFFLAQQLMPCLIAATPASSVINMGSITWAVPGTGLVPYVASKAAVVGLTKTLAREFGPNGVRVNSIMPGAIATERQKREILTAEYEATVLASQSLKRILQPEDIARLALWLVADDSLNMTSQSVVLDGGWI